MKVSKSILILTCISLVFVFCLFLSNQYYYDKGYSEGVASQERIISHNYDKGYDSGYNDASIDVRSKFYNAGILVSGDATNALLVDIDGDGETSYEEWRVAKNNGFIK